MEHASPAPDRRNLRIVSEDEWVPEEDENIHHYVAAAVERFTATLDPDLRQACHIIVAAPTEENPYNEKEATAWLLGPEKFSFTEELAYVTHEAEVVVYDPKSYSMVCIDLTALSDEDTATLRGLIDHTADYLSTMRYRGLL